MSLESLQIEGIVPIPKKCPSCDFVNMGGKQCRGCGCSLVPPEALEWEKEWKKYCNSFWIGTNEDNTKPTLSVPVDFGIEFISHLRDQTLEEAAKALSKNMPVYFSAEWGKHTFGDVETIENKNKEIQIKNHALLEAMITIRSLKK